LTLLGIMLGTYASGNVQDREATLPERSDPGPGPSDGDVAWLRSLALAFVITIAVGYRSADAGPVLMVLSSLAGGAASCALTLYVQLRGRGERIPAARIRA
jgi:hypothetical protein